MISLRTLQWFFMIEDMEDVRRVLRPFFLILFQLSKFWIIFVNCNCTVNVYDNFVTLAEYHPYYWAVTASGIRYVGSPYSPLWYLLNEPARLGYWIWIGYLFVIDSALMTYSFSKRSWKFLMAYLPSSAYLFYVDPTNLWIFFLIIMAQSVVVSKRYSFYDKLIAMGLPVVTKLPIWAPAYVWDFIFHNPFFIVGIPRYTNIGLWYMAMIALYLRFRRTLRSKPS